MLSGIDFKIVVTESGWNVNKQDLPQVYHCKVVWWVTGGSSYYYVCFKFTIIISLQNSHFVEKNNIYIWILKFHVWLAK